MTAPALVELPTYEVPPFVLERFPGFRPEEPSTWPEPDRCTDGRPWGHDAYGTLDTRPKLIEDRWQRHLRYLASPTGKLPHGVCRNRWKDERYRLCGTHLAPFVRNLLDAGRRDRARARELEHLDLARRLAVHGIEADGRSTGVVLQVDAVRELLRRLSHLSGAIPLDVFPTTDLTIPPPL